MSHKQKVCVFPAASVASVAAVSAAAAIAENLSVETNGESVSRENIQMSIQRKKKLPEELFYCIFKLEFSSFLIYMYECFAWRHVDISCVFRTCGVQQKTLEALELDLQMAVSHHVNAGN